MEEMKHPQLPTIDILEYEHLMDSACLGPADWRTFACDIERHYYAYDGFVIVHGTDTMAYTASALVRPPLGTSVACVRSDNWFPIKTTPHTNTATQSYMLENLGKPVVLTGSQLPLAEVYTDAQQNLKLSIIFASQGEFNEVSIFFGNRLLRGCRASKVHSFDLNAFASPNFPPLATVGVNLEIRPDLALPPPRKPLAVHKEMSAHIIVIRLVPGFADDALFAIINAAPTLHGLILLIYGTGNAPSTRSGLLEAVRIATAKGIVVVALTQCHQGGVLLEKYSVGLALKEAGVLSGGDMSTEACATKLAYLFGRLKDPEAVKRHLGMDLRGELSPASKWEKSILTHHEGGGNPTTGQRRIPQPQSRL